MCYYDYVARKKQEQVWKYTKADTDECVRLPKVPADAVPDWESRAADTRKTVEKKFAVLFKGRSSLGTPMSYTVHGNQEEVASYAAAFMLAQQRIRGIDYTQVANKHHFRDNWILNKGWHENIRYFDEDVKVIVNEHANQDELKALTPQSLDEFHAFCCARWNIEVPKEERRLL